jgi:hypothetical protein
MKEVNLMTRKWIFGKYILFFYQDRQWFAQAYLFLETKNLQNAEKCTFDEVFTCLRTLVSFSLHQDDRTLGENDLFSAHLLMFLSEEALCVIWNVSYGDIKMEILRLCQKMTLSMW